MYFVSGLNYYASWPNLLGTFLRVYQVTRAVQVNFQSSARMDQADRKFISAPTSSSEGGIEQTM